MPQVLDYRLHAQSAGITNEPPINTVTEVKLVIYSPELGLRE